MNMELRDMIFFDKIDPFYIDQVCFSNADARRNANTGKDDFPKVTVCHG